MSNPPNKRRKTSGVSEVLDTFMKEGGQFYQLNPKRSDITQVDYAMALQLSGGVFVHAQDYGKGRKTKKANSVSADTCNSHEISTRGGFRAGPHAASSSAGRIAPYSSEEEGDSPYEDGDMDKKPRAKRSAQVGVKDRVDSNAETHCFYDCIVCTKQFAFLKKYDPPLKRDTVKVSDQVRWKREFANQVTAVRKHMSSHGEDFPEDQWPPAYAYKITQRTSMMPLKRKAEPESKAKPKKEPGCWSDTVIFQGRFPVVSI
jgi:hypothetical protein